MAKRDLTEMVQKRVNDERRYLQTLASTISQAGLRIVARSKASLGVAAARLNALSPLATLSRGYAVARDQDGRALTSAGQFAPGLKFDLLLHDGQIAARTEQVSGKDLAG